MASLSDTKEPLPLNQKIQITLINNLFKQAKIGFLASLLCATIVFIFFYNTLNPVLITWYISFLLVMAFRIILVRQYFKQKQAESHYLLWRNLFIIGAFLNGVTWGVTGSPLILPTESNLSQALVMVILAGISAGAVPLLAPSRAATFAFLLPALLPLIINLYLTHNHIYHLFNATIVIYLIYLIILTIKSHNLIKNYVRLQFENQLLVEDLSKAKHQLETTNKKLELAATHDPLTHVANRRLFEVDFLEAIQRAKQNHTLLGLLYLDLDNFKNVNDFFGHTAGDQVLLETVDRINSTVRYGDIISRLGGDELTIIFEDIRTVEAIANIAERICQIIAKPIYFEKTELHVYASIGIAIYPVDGTDMDTLLKVADKAMYYVKDHGGNNYHFNIQLESNLDIPEANGL